MSQEQPKREFTGAWIPKAIWTHSELSWMERCLWAEIRNLDGQNGCWATNEYLAKMMGSTKSSIANMMSKLRRMGLVVEIGFDGRKRFIRAIEPNQKVKAAFTDGSSQGSLTGERRMHQLVNKDTRIDSYVENKENNTPTPQVLVESTKAKRVKRQMPEVPAALDTKDFHSVWEDWLADRQLRKKPVTPLAAKRQLKQLEQWGISKAIYAVNQAIEKGWQGIYEPKDYKAQGHADDTRGPASMMKEPDGWLEAAETVLQQYEGAALERAKEYIAGGWRNIPMFFRDTILEELGLRK